MLFLYWIPKPHDVDQVRREIGYAFEGAKGEAVHKEVLSGPGGNGAGLLMADRYWKSQIDRVKLDLENQYWRKIPGSIAWVGCYRSDKLSPGDLQRSELVEGIGVEMADGSIWQCAHARKFVEVEQQMVGVFGFTIPNVLEMNEEGKWTPTKVSPRFARFVELATMYWDACVAAMDNADDGAESLAFQFDEIDELAILGLTANYRLGPSEVALTNIYDVESRQRLVRAIMDEATFQRWLQKKTDAGLDGSDTSRGQTNSITAG